MHATAQHITCYKAGIQNVPKNNNDKPVNWQTHISASLQQYQHKTTKQVVYSRQLLNHVCVLYSVTSMMSGQVYSEWRIPSEWEGEDLKVMLHFSGLCVPGPGFLVVSVVGRARVCACHG